MEPVTEVSNGISDAAEELVNTELPLSSSIKESDVPPKNGSEVLPIAEETSANASSSSPNIPCDINSNFQQHAKTKGTLRQQLRKKRQQLVSSNVTAPCVEKSAVSSEKKKSVSPNRAASQVNYYYI